MMIETDVLVIGGGGAGARATLEAHQEGAKVTLAVKGSLGITGIRGSGATGGGGVNMFRYFPSDPKRVVDANGTKGAADDLNLMLDRSIKAGLGMADRKLIKVLVENALEARQNLDKWGVTLEIFFDPSEVARWIAPLPGLTNIIRSNKKINLQERMMVTDLLIQDGTCVGAIGFREDNGEACILKAISTILATGGNAQLYMLNFHPSCVTGDGYAMGYRAGAEMVNMEFEQIFPTTVYPSKNIIAPNIWQLCPKILNVNGDEFIQNYIPQNISVEEVMKQKALHGPYSARDSSKYLEISMIKETKAGRANEHNAFYLEVPKSVRDPVGLSAPKLSVYNLSIYNREWYEYRGIDWNKDFVEIGVIHQCSDGGFRINENGQTTILGLYAVGESAAGPYGADRLGGMMQAACQVFGMRAGKHAAENAKIKDSSVLNKNIAESQLKRVATFKKLKGDQKPFNLKKSLQKIAWDNLLAVRSKGGITQFLQEIEHIRNDLLPRLNIKNTSELIEALELDNLLIVGGIVAKAALMREESRGGHYREDFPEHDDSNWLKSISVMRVAGKMQLNAVKLDEEWKGGIEDLGKDLHWG